MAAIITTEDARYTVLYTTANPCKEAAAVWAAAYLAAPQHNDSKGHPVMHQSRVPLEHQVEVQVQRLDGQQAGLLGALV